mmetsp:Transcript_127461/g.285077  ORF Transcript_127461/g.285077 Transcript_127461/m.285077 type:complete len:254 (-) Transcript_127461:474-1235(-)
MTALLLRWGQLRQLLLGPRSPRGGGLPLRVDERVKLCLPTQGSREGAATGVAIALVPHISPIATLLLQVEAEALAHMVAGSRWIAVDQETGHAGGCDAHKAGKRHDHEGSAQHDKQIARGEIQGMQIQEAIWKLLSEENDLRLHEIPFSLAERLPTLLTLFHGSLQLSNIDKLLRLGVDDMCLVEVAMGSDELFRGKPGLLLQGIDVLRIAPEEHALIVQHPDEVVRRRRLEVPRPHLLGKLVKCVGPRPEVV